MHTGRSRLDRLVARYLGISRDAVRELLARQSIVVDGQTATARDQQVDAFSAVSVDGRILQASRPLHIMLHKPCGVLSATRDSRHRVVIDLLDHPARTTLHIAGRLDLHASGLLLLSNDGRWSRQLSDPAAGIGKVYLVTVKYPLTDAYAPAFAAGMYFGYENLTTRPAALEILDAHTARITLQEGRYHQLKRMFGRFRNPVTGIHRIATGQLQLDGVLAPGQWRELTDAEAVAACTPAD